MAEQLEVAGADGAVDFVILDHQHAQLALAATGRQIRRRFGWRQAIDDREFEDEGETGALAFPRLGGDLAPHRLHDALADGEAKAGAAVALVRRFLDLEERLENLRQLFLGDADAGIRHREPQADVARGGFAQGVDGQRYRALVGELDRIADDVEQQLVQLAPVANDEARQGGSNLADQRDALALRGHRLQRQHVFQCLAQVEGLALEFELAGLDARETEHVLEDFQQGAVGVADHVDVLGLPGIEPGFAQQPRRPADPGKRRAQFMAQRAQEQVLGRVGLFGLLPGQRVLGDLALKQGVAFLEFGGTLGHLHLEFPLVPPQFFFQTFAFAHVFTDLLQRSSERRQRVVSAGGDIDIEIAGAQRPRRLLHAAQAAEHVIAINHPEGDDQRHEKQDGDDQEAEQPAVDGPLPLPAGGFDDLAAGGDQRARLLVQQGGQAAPLVAQQLQRLALRQPGMVQGKDAAFTAGRRKNLVVREADFLQARIANIVHPPLEGTEVGGKAFGDLGNRLHALLALELLEQGLDIDADELEFGHPLHRVDIDLSHAVQRFVDLVAPAVALKQAVEVGDVGRRRRRGVGDHGFRQPEQGLDGCPLAGEGLAFQFVEGQALFGARRLLAQVLVDRICRRAQVAALLIVDMLRLEAVQRPAHFLEPLAQRLRNPPRLVAAAHHWQLLDQRTNAGDVGGQALHGRHGRDCFVDDFRLGTHHLFEAEPRHGGDDHGEHRRGHENQQQLADQAGVHAWAEHPGEQRFRR